MTNSRWVAGFQTHMIFGKPRELCDGMFGAKTISTATVEITGPNLPKLAAVDRRKYDILTESESNCRMLEVFQSSGVLSSCHVR